VLGLQAYVTIPGLQIYFKEFKHCAFSLYSLPNNNETLENKLSMNAIDILAEPEMIN
jgi:hypothetical protein